MADLNAIRQALASVLQTALPNLRVFADFISAPPLPAAVITPQPQQALRFDAMGGAVTYPLRIMLLGSYTEDNSSQVLIDSYMSTTGPNSIDAVLKANPTLGGAVDYCNIDRVNGYGLIEWAGQQYLGTQFMLSAAAT